LSDYLAVGCDLRFVSRMSEFLDGEGQTDTGIIQAPTRRHSGTIQAPPRLHLGTIRAPATWALCSCTAAPFGLQLKTSEHQRFTMRVSTQQLRFGSYICLVAVRAPVCIVKACKISLKFGDHEISYWTFTKRAQVGELHCARTRNTPFKLLVSTSSHVQVPVTRSML
jgi:hypothetical protein